MNFWIIWVWARPNGIVVSWLRLQTASDCIPYPYHMYTKFFSFLTCCGWKYRCTLTLLLFGRGAQSTTQGSLFNSWVLFFICYLYYSYGERVTSWVVSIYYLKYFTVKYCTCKKTPRATINVPKIYVRMTLENNTQGITFNHDVGIAIWVLETLKLLRQYWYC